MQNTTLAGALEHRAVLDSLMSGACCFMDQLDGSQTLATAHSDSHQGPPPSMERRSCLEAPHSNLSATQATQRAAQLSGGDVPMLEELLPFSELHDPFTEAWQHHHAFSQQAGVAAASAAAAAGQHPVDAAAAAISTIHGCHGSGGGGDGGGPFSSTQEQLGYFGGIPAYAEPSSQAAALLNQHPPGLAGEPARLPSLAYPSLQALRGVCHASHAAHLASAFGAQHDFAAHRAAAVEAAGACGLPPAIAVAQQRAQQHMLAQQHMQTQQQCQAERAGSELADTSHVSNGSHVSAVNTSVRPTGPGAAVGMSAAAGPAGACGMRPSDDSSDAEQQNAEGDLFDDDDQNNLTGSDLLAQPSGSLFTVGSGGGGGPSGGGGTGGGGHGLAKRSGRPREKKSYDSLIDPSLPADEVRRLRRMLSNRESARRSRRRRQSQVSTLGVELELLKTDNERLEGELTHASSFVQQLAADKQALLREVERLRGQLMQHTQGHPSPFQQPHQQPHQQQQQQQQQLAPASFGLAAPAQLHPFAVPHLQPEVQPIHSAPGHLAASLACHLAPQASLTAGLSPVGDGGSGRLPRSIEEAQRLANNNLSVMPRGQEAHILG